MGYCYWTAPKLYIALVLVFLYWFWRVGIKRATLLQESSNESRKYEDE